MAALSELWGMNEESLDTIIRARDGRHAFRAPVKCGWLHESMLGDKLLAGACETATHAAELAAPAERVWPWLAQLMRGAGIYGWSTLESPRCRSADHLLSGLPLPRLGDQVGQCLILAGLEPGSEIVWVASEPVRLLGHELSGLSLDYAIRPTTEGAGDSCLVARLRFASPGMTEQVSSLIRSTLEVLLIGTQMQRLRETIHNFEASQEDGHTPARSPSRHQLAAFKPALLAGALTSRRPTAKVAP
jgi:hypothetical protein